MAPHEPQRPPAEPGDPGQGPAREEQPGSWEVYRPDPPGATRAPRPLPEPRRGSAPLLVALGAIALVAGAGIVAVVVLAGGGDAEQQGTEAPAPAIAQEVRPEAPPQLHTPEGWRSLVQAVREETGGTRAFSVVLYPEYAVLDLPVQATGSRFHSYRFDGELTMSTKGTSPYRVFDLGRIDPAVTGRLLATARRELVEDPTSTYAIIRRPDEGTAWYSVYASNEYSESGFIQADLAGVETRRYLSPP
ncbi:hypothetical protein [Nocardioides nanhaiensis]|uniref:Uncharacterized protein n=1 Tax=Nocardioides nanhaiensis TaxID=1476871 RepID=A0ABP8W6Q6_9ACTN